MARPVRLIFLGTGVARGALVPFAVLLLTDVGLEAGAVGLVLGAAAVGLLVALPAWGLLADRVIGARWTLLLGGLLAAAGAAIGLVGRDAAALSLAIPIATAGIAAASPVGDALALGALGDGRDEYGTFRRWTSGGWAVSALAVGALVTTLGPPVALGTFAVAAVAIGVVAFAMPADRGAPSDADVPDPTDVPVALGMPGTPPTVRAPSPVRTPATAVLRDPALLGFLAAVFLVGLGTAAATAFVPLRIIDEGGSAFVIGIAAAIPALVEIPLFSSTGTLARRLGLSRLYVTGALGASAQIAIVALVPVPAVVALVSAADGASFACRQAASVLIVDRRVPTSLRALGQSLAWFAGAGCAPIVATTLGGAIYASFGGSALFWCAALTVVLGATLAAFVLRDASSGTGDGRSRRRKTLNVNRSPR